LGANGEPFYESEVDLRIFSSKMGIGLFLLGYFWYITIIHFEEDFVETNNLIVWEIPFWTQMNADFLD